MVDLRSALERVFGATSQDLLKKTTTHSPPSAPSPQLPAGPPNAAHVCI
uniref:Predicted protein n=1 Tax=Hordeum vulgare subsp. vulgare TaxID=112509 RepID=F2D3Y7_HORVV|nr:predicted protein [Hordeum vulgare subsp. vulgare]